MKNKQAQIIVFTDLDGTLLNHDDYSFEAARPTIVRLKKMRIPLIVVTSKTIAEVKELRVKLDLESPYICENGSLVAIPEAYAYLSKYVSATRTIENSETVCVKGNTRTELLSVLDRLHQSYRFRHFAQMSDAEIVEHTGLRLEQASQANQRLGSEPMLWQDDETKLKSFIDQVEAQGLRVVRGGRFYHIMGNTDKSEAVTEIISAFERYNSVTVHSVALGDSENDLDMLRAATTAVVMPKLDGSYMTLDHSNPVIYSPKHGASGWSESMEELLNQLIPA